MSKSNFNDKYSDSLEILSDSDDDTLEIPCDNEDSTLQILSDSDDEDERHKSTPSNDEEFYKVCDHKFFDKDHTCLQCGALNVADLEYIETTMKNKKTAEKNILNEMKELKHPECIKKKANDIFKEIAATGLIKYNNKKRATMYCLFEAYRSTGKIPDPVTIGAELGLGKRDVKCAFYTYKPIYYPNYKNAPLSYIPPDELITSYCKRLRICDQTINDIKIAYNKFLTKNKKFCEQPPVTLISGYISSYLSYHSIEVDKNAYKEIFLRSFGTVKSMELEINMLELETGK